MIHVGIDIGKSTLDVCRSKPHEPPTRWPVYKIHLEAPNWHHQLQALIPPAAVITVEPTGWHYLTPLLTALRDVNAVIWQVPTTTTRHIRAVHISGSKSDRTDAQALALAAEWLANGRHVHGAYPLDTAREASVTQLRLMINAHRRMTKTRTRTLNQLDALAHGLWPALAQHKALWLRAARAGAITPQQIIALARRQDLKTVPGYEHHLTRRALQRLAALLPDDVTPPQDTVRQVEDLLAQHDALTAQLQENAAAITRAVTLPPFDEVTARWRTVPYAVPRQGEYPGQLLGIATLHVATRAHAQDYTKDQFKAALGAHPRTRQSGDSVTRDRHKKGYRPAMTTLYTWTMRLIRPAAVSNPVRDYYNATTTRYRMQAAVNKLARILWGVARDPEGFRYN